MSIRSALKKIPSWPKMSYPPPYIVNPKLGHDHMNTVILLHGRGSTARKFASDLFALKTSESENLCDTFPNIRWVFPDAGERWCTSYKENMPSWCDTFSLDDLSLRQDLQIEGLRSGVLHVKSIVESETKELGERSDRLVLGGFSQGSAMALWALFSGAAATQGPPGGFIGIGAWMPFTREAKQAVTGGAEPQSRNLQNLRAGNLAATFLEILGLDPPVSISETQKYSHRSSVFLGHGTDDTIVSVTNCHDLSAIFQALELNTTVREYTGATRDGHWVKEPEQLDDMVAFLNKVMFRSSDHPPFSDSQKSSLNNNTR